ncbi:hypothetical protein Rcae01_05227 [Novipirellula caenicola]|uniref:Uncharacterized protein n=1 Tax=Novipirellula caenicola TaxID=1536901 RepID=A0ABP9VX53_9BACT
MGVRGIVLNVTPAWFGTGVSSLGRFLPYVYGIRWQR